MYALETDFDRVDQNSDTGLKSLRDLLNSNLAKKAVDAFEFDLVPTEFDRSSDCKRILPLSYSAPLTREAWMLDASLSREGKPRVDQDEICPHVLFAVVVFFAHDYIFRLAIIIFRRC